MSAFAKVLSTVTLMSALALPGARAAIEERPLPDGSAASVFELYERNRAAGVPSYVTVDLPLTGYALLCETSLIELETKRLVPGLARFVDALAAALETDEGAEADAAERNLALASLLDALLRTDPSDLDGEALAEYERVLGAAGVERSPWWSRDVDYSQFVPRGRYAGDPGLEGFFRAMRYAGAQPFLVTASGATGVDDAASRLQTRQGAQLARLLRVGGPLREAHEDLESALDWQIGPARELGAGEWEEARASVAAERNTPAGEALDDEGVDALRTALLERARVEDRQPRVLDAVLDVSALEPGTSAADALTGLRLIGARETAEGAAVQRLLYPGTGTYTGDDGQDVPFGLGRVAGREVKAFPEARETLALLGDEHARERLDAGGSDDFEGYDAAFADARELVDGAGAAEALHHRLLRAGLKSLAHRDAEAREQSLLAFHARRRYLDVLYARQPYTPIAKSFGSPQARPGADLEPATELYVALAVAAREQARRTGHDGWERFAERMDELQRISFARERGAMPTLDEQAFLNGLDRALRVDGAVEAPIVVDVHTDPTSATVVQLATGLAREVSRGEARGARASFHEFREPLSARLTPAAWRDRLGVGDTGVERPAPAGMGR